MKSAAHIRARLVAAKICNSLVGVGDIERPARFDGDSRAVLHGNETESRILDGVLCGIPIAPCVAGTLLVAELLIDIADNHFWLVVVHHPECEVERVGADIDKRTAALLILVEENAPCRNSSAAQCDGAAVIDIAEIAVVARLLEIERIGSPALLIADSQLLAGALCGLVHFLRLGIGLCHGLLTHDMLARFERVYCDERMRAVRSADMNAFNALVLEQLSVIRIDFCALNAELLCRLYGSLINDIAESDHLGLFDFFERGHMLAVGDSAAADDAYSDFSSHIVSPIVFKIYYIPFSVSITPTSGAFQKSKSPLRKEKRPKRRRDCFEQAAIFQKC